MTIWIALAALGASCRPLTSTSALTSTNEDVATPALAGTVTGNPKPKTARIDVELGGVSSSTSAVSLCASAIRFFPEAGQPVAIALPLVEFTVTSTYTRLATVEIPMSTYVSIELDLSATCANQQSIRIMNSSGTFRTSESVTSKFTGAYTPVASEALQLEFKPISDSLGAVTDNSQIKPVVETTSGLVNPTAPQARVTILRADAIIESSSGSSTISVTNRGMIDLFALSQDVLGVLGFAPDALLPQGQTLKDIQIYITGGDNYVSYPGFWCLISTSNFQTPALSITVNASSRDAALGKLAFLFDPYSVGNSGGDCVLSPFQASVVSR